MVRVTAQLHWTCGLMLNRDSIFPNLTRRRRAGQMFHHQLSNELDYLRSFCVKKRSPECRSGRLGDVTALWISPIIPRFQLITTDVEHYTIPHNNARKYDPGHGLVDKMRYLW